MFGAMFGDYVGSVYEFDNIKTKDFDLFNLRANITDDSLMTIAVASACMDYAIHGHAGKFSDDVTREMLRIGRKYTCPMGGYGTLFRKWLESKDPAPYGSWGNGSAMRVSPCGWVAKTLAEAEKLGEHSALPTHNHPDAVLGAKVVAGCVYLARTGALKDEIRGYIRKNGYPMTETLDEIRPDYGFDGSCKGTVSVALQAFLESESFEDAIRNAVSVGGDSDTLAAITGSVAEAFYGIPDNFSKALGAITLAELDDWEREIVERFRRTYCDPE